MSRSRNCRAVTVLCVAAHGRECYRTAMLTVAAGHVVEVHHLSVGPRRVGVTHRILRATYCPSASMCRHLTWIMYLACERDVDVEISLATPTGLAFMFIALQTMYWLLVHLSMYDRRCQSSRVTSS
jgi:hypothetical protein